MKKTTSIMNKAKTFAKALPLAVLPYVASQAYAAEPVAPAPQTNTATVSAQPAPLNPDVTVRDRYSVRIADNNKDGVVAGFEEAVRSTFGSQGIPLQNYRFKVLVGNHVYSDVRFSPEDSSFVAMRASPGAPSLTQLDPKQIYVVMSVAKVKDMQDEPTPQKVQKYYLSKSQITGSSLEDSLAATVVARKGNFLSVQQPGEKPKSAKELADADYVNPLTANNYIAVPSVYLGTNGQEGLILKFKQKVHLPNGTTDDGTIVDLDASDLTLPERAKLLELAGSHDKASSSSNSGNGLTSFLRVMPGYEHAEASVTIPRYSRGRKIGETTVTTPADAITTDIESRLVLPKSTFVDANGRVAYVLGTGALGSRVSLVGGYNAKDAGLAFAVGGNAQLNQTAAGTTTAYGPSAEAIWLPSSDAELKLVYDALLSGTATQHREAIRAKLGSRFAVEPEVALTQASNGKTTLNSLDANVKATYMVIPKLGVFAVGGYTKGLDVGNDTSAYRGAAGLELRLD